MYKQSKAELVKIMAPIYERLHGIYLAREKGTLLFNYFFYLQNSSTEGLKIFYFMVFLSPCEQFTIITDLYVLDIYARRVSRPGCACGAIVFHTVIKIVAINVIIVHAHSEKWWWFI